MINEIESFDKKIAELQGEYIALREAIAENIALQRKEDLVLRDISARLDLISEQLIALHRDSAALASAIATIHSQCTALVTALVTALEKNVESSGVKKKMGIFPSFSKLQNWIKRAGDTEGRT